MVDNSVPYWFWQGFGLIIFALVGQVLIKWVDHKFFGKEDKWSGEERRSAQIDERWLVEFLDTYKKHVKLVSELTENFANLNHKFQEHDDAESRNHRLIKEVHDKVVLG